VTPCSALAYFTVRFPRYAQSEYQEFHPDIQITDTSTENVEPLVEACALRSNFPVSRVSTDFLLSMEEKDCLRGRMSCHFARFPD
jgi:hypothetical protein